MKRFALVFITCAFIAATGAAFAQTRIPRINYRERTLTNGLRVLSVLDKSSPTVTIDVCYHVGSKDDPTIAAALPIFSSTSCSNRQRT